MFGSLHARETAITKVVALAVLVATWNLSAAQEGSFGEAVDNAMATPPDFNGVWLAAPGCAAPDPGNSIGRYEVLEDR